MDTTSSVAKNFRSLDLLPCRQLKGVGPQLAEKLARCGIHSLQDILFHLPLRYQDRTQMSVIANLQPGDTAQVTGVIRQANVRLSPKRSLVCTLSDGTGNLTLRFFHFNKQQQEKLTPGTQITVFGEVRGWAAEVSMIHPEYRSVSDEKPQKVAATLTPVYPSTAGLSQKTFLLITDQALHFLQRGAALPEYLPLQLLQELNLPTLTESILYVHRPPPDADTQALLQGTHLCQQRLAFEELLAHHLSLRNVRKKIQEHPAPELENHDNLKTLFLQNLPFKLTQAQQRVSQEITEDLMLNKPALRLVQGDVGSGKTAVAAMAALQAIDNGYQVALMAPTEILAEQHFQTFHKWLGALNLTTLFLSGKHKGKKREQILQELQAGAPMIIGTHALFQEDVQFSKLGLIIIDEQHRFGVQQRLALRAKGQVPHQIIMSATPIPRSLAMIAYADLDHSVIDELPPGRTPIVTVVLPQARRLEILQRIQEAAKQKRQTYWICTLIEESETLQCQAAEATYLQLKNLLPECCVGLVHGRMKADEKQEMMHKFKQGEIDLLIATTVIEVGVDVPNASLMVIDNAERLGLAQIHQLRGRVGRGNLASHCVLLFQAPLSYLARERLKVLRESNDGFAIAQRDLELRGPGEVLGTRQAGMMQFRIADLNRDKALLTKVNQATKLLNAATIAAIVKRWLGQNEKFASA